MSMVDIKRGQFWQVSAGENLLFPSPRHPPFVLPARRRIAILTRPDTHHGSMSMADIDPGQLWQVSAGESLLFAPPAPSPVPPPGAATDSHPDMARFMKR
jgi:hypothetical protein